MKKKKIAWSSLKEFSFKDVISIVLTITFIATMIFGMVYYIYTKDSAFFELIKTQIPIVLAIIGIYGTTEGAELFMKKYQQNYEQNDQNTIFTSTTTSTLPISETQTGTSTNTTTSTPDVNGGI